MPTVLQACTRDLVLEKIQRHLGARENEEKVTGFDVKEKRQPVVVDIDKTLQGKKEE